MLSVSFFGASFLYLNLVDVAAQAGRLSSSQLFHACEIQLDGVERAKIVTETLSDL